MSRMYKCNRCGETFSDNDYSKKTFTYGTKVCTGDSNESRKHLTTHHLCPKCSDDFYQWLWYKDDYKVVRTKKRKKYEKKLAMQREKVRQDKKNGK